MSDTNHNTTVRYIINSHAVKNKLQHDKGFGAATNLCRIHSSSLGEIDIPPALGVKGPSKSLFRFNVMIYRSGNATYKGSF